MICISDSPWSSVSFTGILRCSGSCISNADTEDLWSNVVKLRPCTLLPLEDLSRTCFGKGLGSHKNLNLTALICEPPPSASIAQAAGWRISNPHHMSFGMPFGTSWTAAWKDYFFSVWVKCLHQPPKNTSGKDASRGTVWTLRYSFLIGNHDDRVSPDSKAVRG